MVQTQGYQSITSASRRASPFSGRRRPSLRHLTLSLTTAATAGGGPGEVGDRDDEEAVAVVGDTSQSIVPGGESGQETEKTTRLLDLGVDATVHGLQIGDTEEEEGQVQEEEEREEGDGRLEGAEDQEKGEDEPALEKLVTDPCGSPCEW